MCNIFLFTGICTALDFVALACLCSSVVQLYSDYLTFNTEHYVLCFPEGRGSLHSYFKARGWATSLAAGVGDDGMHRSSVAYVFRMDIYLTDSGLDKVASLCYL